MRNSMKNLVVAAGCLAMYCLLSPISASAGDTAYVADSLTISLRQSPDPKSSIIKALKTDNVLEIIEKQDRYLRVRTPAGDEGWIHRQYVSSQTPKTQIIATLKTELAGLKDKVEQLQDANTSNSAEVKASQAQYDKIKDDLAAAVSQLAAMTDRYNTLLNQSTNVTELVQENEALRANIDKLNKDMQTLRLESTHLKRTDMIPWFLSGGGVFLAGFIVAKLGADRKKKSFY